MIGILLQTCVISTYGILSAFTCGFAVPGFIFFIEILAFGLAYMATKRLVMGGLMATMVSFLALTLSTSTLYLTIAGSLAIITILAFALEHRMHAP